MTSDTLIQGAIAELAAVVGALLDAPATASPSPDAVTTRWAVSMTLAGPFAATVVFGFDADGAQALARQVMALDGEPADSAVSDTLLEVCGQAVSAVTQRDGFAGMRLAERKIVPAPPASDATTITVAAGAGYSASIACWASVDRASAVAAPDAAPRPAAATATAAAPANLDLILDIELPLTVRFGEAEMTLLSLTRLAPGSIIDLGRSPDDPVDVLVNGRLVARGEVVVVSGNYGVRIVEVISAADRLKTVAA